VLVQLQEHIGHIRGNIDGANRALGLARLDSVGAAHAARTGLDAVRSRLDEAASHAGEVQGILAAATQMLYSRRVADPRLEDVDSRPDDQVPPR
jgi:hypothetical protein